MEIKTLTEVETTVMYLSGRFDAHTTQAFSEAAALLNGRLVVDLAQVIFIDSRGLAALISVYHRLGALLTLRDPQDAVRLIFEVTKLDQIFLFEPVAA